MSRTTTAAVQAILSAGGDYDEATSPDLQPFVDTASAVVDRVVACASRQRVSLSDSEQELIERWLAAHCYGCSDQPYTQRKTQDAMGKFQGATGMSLDSTKYGQMAKTLDYSGCLSAISKQRKARLTWLGKPPSSQIPLDQRE